MKLEMMKLKKEEEAAVVKSRLRVNCNKKRI